jgi:outer membrane protein assembly factor BamB
MYAIDSVTEMVVWMYFLGAPVVASAAMGADGKLYVVSGTGEITAFDGKTGRAVWSFILVTSTPTVLSLSSPSISGNGVLFVGVSDGSLAAVYDGVFRPQQPSCSLPCDDTPWPQFLRTRDHNSTSPFYGPQTFSSTAIQWVSNTTIPRLPVSEVTSTPILGLHNVLYYTTVSPGYLFAVQQTDGARLWSFACDGDVVGTPALSTADGLVFVGTSNGTIFALESLTAEIMWTQALGDSVSTSVVVDNDRLYVGTTTGMVYSFYLDDGGLLGHWLLQAPSLQLRP